jgi:tRNA dimethylallyltransferase
VVKVALNPPERSVLHERIAARFHEMMGEGFLDEVARLRARGDLTADLPSLRAVGYRQLWAHLDGAWDLATAVARGIAATRQFAKRQLTWLRAEPGLAWRDPREPGLAEAVAEQIAAAAVQAGC